MISKETLEILKQKADLVKFFEQHGLAFRTAGGNYVALCPFHNERSPSFNVNPHIQRYHCFGCGESGDIISAVQELEHLDFASAAQYIADEIGMEIHNEEDDEKYRKLRRLRDLTQKAADYFRAQYLELPDSHPAKQNLAERNLLQFSLTDESIGFAPLHGVVSHLYELRYSKQELLEAGILKPVQNEGEELKLIEVFRNRLTWTIYDAAGKAIGFSGRKVMPNESEKAPKYVNSPKTLLYDKSRVLLGLKAARKTINEERAVYVVEGQTDVMALQAVGVENVVASCGTAFGKEHVETLERLAASSKKKNEQFKLYLCFDGDAAGEEAVKKVFNNIPHVQLTSWIIPLHTPDGESTDPCDLRQNYGDQALINSLEAPITMIEFILKSEMKRWDLSTVEGKAGFVEAIRGTLSLVTNPIAHEAYVKKVGVWTGIPYQQLLRSLRHLNRPQYQEQEMRDGEVKLASIDDRVLAAFLQYPSMMTTLWLRREVQFSTFTNPVEATDIITKQPADSPLHFADLGIPDGREEEALTILINRFLKAKYLEAVEHLNSRFAEKLETGEESALEDFLKRQKNLKVMYQQ